MILLVCALLSSCSLRQPHWLVLSPHAALLQLIPCKRCDLNEVDRAADKTGVSDLDMTTIPIAADDRLFVLTGAGISAESGLPTFRASDGLWAGHRIEDVCTPEALEENPALVWEFYSQRRAQGAKAEPNPAHRALAGLEAKLGDRFFLCTQNVDDLHERAGSTQLVHMHGELAKSRCEAECGQPPVEDRRVYASLHEVGRCVYGARLRPH